MGHVNIPWKRGRNSPIQNPGPFMVVNIGLGIDMGSQNPDQLLLFDQPADLTARIIEITKGTAFGRTCDDAGGFLPTVEPMPAEITLVGNSLNRISIPGSVRAGCDTITAADALDRINGHHPVRLFIGRTDRTGSNARGIITLHTLARLEFGVAASVQIPHGANPIPPEPIRKLVLDFTGDHAGLAVNAFGCVDNDPIFFGSALCHIRVL